MKTPEFVHRYRVLYVKSALTKFHYTERYRYTDTVYRYACRGYMVINRLHPVHAGTVYHSAEDADEALYEAQDWLRRAGMARQADQLKVEPIETIEVVWKKKAYKLN